MKKVLMVCESFGGGVFAYLSQLCNDMSDDFEVYLAYAVRPQTPSDYMNQLDPRIHLIEVREFSEFKNPVTLAKVIYRLRQIERSVRPDVIHLHSSIAGGLGRIAFHNRSESVVYTPHGYAFVLMGGGLKSRGYWCLEKILGRTGALTLTCCESEDEVARSFGSRTAYIETGVNVTELSRAVDDVRAFRGERFTVYAMGRACTQKQPKVFNEIARLVPEASFIWIGSGELEDQLTETNVAVTGWQPRNEALAIAKGADAYVLCSLGEAIAMSLIENMYLGKLCLVSDVMGNRSVIADGVNGYVCASTKEFAERIRDAMSAFPTDIVTRAYRDVLTTYNTSEMKKKYIRFYEEVCHSRATYDTV